MSSRVCRVVIVEDAREFREAVALLLNSTHGFQCSGAYDSSEAALRALRTEPPDVLLLDVQLPGMPGSQAARLFHERFPSLPILMFTVFENEDVVFESLCNGAIGYLLKNTHPTRFLEAVRDAMDGGAPMSPAVARKVVQTFREGQLAARRPPEHSLTSQEVRLLALLGDGHSYATAAADMELSINTVRNYIRSIYDKLHVHSKSAAVSKALKNGIL